MFDARHHEMAQLEVQERASRTPKRMSRNVGRKQSSLLVRKQKSESVLEQAKRALVLNTAGY
ncbi:hypothetical protein IWW50_003832 [Coemansia erecta]|nr:hypothetical protein IWW50_003832 [Coemansia erecta]